MPYTRMILAGLAVVGVLLYLFWQPAESSLDQELRGELIKIGQNRSYAMEVDTWVSVYDRNLSIVGRYLLDEPNRAYASYSTTTLEVPKTGEKHSFSLGIISLQDNSYLQLLTESPVLKKTLPLTSWRYVPKETLETEFKGIASGGPILDTAKLFSDNLRYVVFRERREDSELNGNTFERYVFTLAEPEAKPGGTLQTLFERIGSGGTIEVWVQEHTPRLFVFSGPSYYSTTTIFALPSIITAPSDL
jgi:hypothetical protein